MFFCPWLARCCFSNNERSSFFRLNSSRLMFKWANPLNVLSNCWELFFNRLASSWISRIFARPFSSSSGMDFFSTSSDKVTILARGVFQSCTTCLIISSWRRDRCCWVWDRYFKPRTSNRVSATMVRMSCHDLSKKKEIGKL